MSKRYETQGFGGRSGAARASEPSPGRSRGVVEGETDFYARVLRVGGDPKITARLEIGKQRGTYPVADRVVAKALAQRLFETAKIRASVAWDRETLKIRDLTVLDVDEDWQDVHLADIMEQHGGRLPFDIPISATELLAERRRDREGD